MATAKEQEIVQVDGQDVTISNPSTVLSPQAGVTKRDLVQYFLTVADIVKFARSGKDRFGNPIDKILCQGRGSAANSTICYVLGVTEVNPDGGHLMFERFVSEERGEPPDIDKLCPSQVPEDGKWRCDHLLQIVAHRHGCEPVPQWHERNLLPRDALHLRAYFLLRCLILGEEPLIAQCLQLRTGGPAEEAFGAIAAQCPGPSASNSVHKQGCKWLPHPMFPVQG